MIGYIAKAAEIIETYSMVSSYQCNTNQCALCYNQVFADHLFASGGKRLCYIHLCIPTAPKLCSVHSRHSEFDKLKQKSTKVQILVGVHQHYLLNV